MVIYSFNFSTLLSDFLGISFEEVSELSDQNINLMPDDYGKLKGYKMPIEFGIAISEACKGRTANNKGKPNPAQRERFITNNPMKNPEIAAKVANKLKGKKPWNKGTETKIKKPILYGKDGRKKTICIFPNGNVLVVEDTRLMCERLGLSFSAVRHKIGKGPYKTGVHKGLSITHFDYKISQEPDEQANS